MGRPIMGTLRILRRVGGLRRLLFGFFLILVGMYCFQTFVLNNSQRDKSSQKWVNVGKNGRRPQSIGGKLQPLFINEVIEKNNGSHSAASATDAPAKLQPKKTETEDQKNKPPEARVEKTIKKQCGLEQECGSAELIYKISAVLGESNRPQACLNDLSIFRTDKLAKGLNVVILDELTHQVLEIQYFDMLSEVKKDLEFITFISGFAANHRSNQQIIFVASWGDFAERLTEKSRLILQKFGSGKVGDLKKGNSFVMVGQKGLKPGLAFEQIAAVNDKDTEGVAEVFGCLKLPIGEIDPKVSFEDEDHHREAPNVPKVAGPSISRREKIIYGVELPHCGMKDPCSKKGLLFPVSVYSGKHKDDVPKMCINGRFVVDRNLNKAGRGLNIVVLNSSAQDVLRVGHFDTYAEDSSTLEIFLEQIVPGEMIIVLSFDEASTRLSSMAKQMFYELGSGLVQNLKFRASWYFVGQKGISGFTPFEELNYASGTEWAKPVDQKICVPAKLDGQKIRPDPPVSTKNDARRHFCKKNDGYEEFCDEAHVDKLLTAAPLFNKSMDGNPIFNVPLLVVAGLAHNSLRLCLETILRQPGINTQKVLVTFDENYPEGGDLGKLFGFQTMAVNASASYTSQLSKSLEAVWSKFPESDVGIVLEEELMLTGDFLVYMSQLLPILKKDESILSVSAWNDNGFLGSATRTDAAYRVEGFPGLGFMIRKSTYSELLANQNCLLRNFSPLQFDRHVQFYIQHSFHSTDVSRVIRRHSDGLGVLEPHLEDLFHRERAYTREPHVDNTSWTNCVNTVTLRLINSEVTFHMRKSGHMWESAPWLIHPEYLLRQQYDTQLNYSLASAKPLDAEAVKTCMGSVANGGTPGPKDEVLLPKIDNKKQPFALYFWQTVQEDHNVLRNLCKCFGLYSSADKPARGMYKSVLRFSYQEHPMFLVGSKSPFFSQKPPNYKLIGGKL